MKTLFIYGLGLLCLAGAVRAQEADRGKPLKSTTGAVLRSMTVPGWGQLYTDHYVKAAAFAAVEGALLFSISWNNDQMRRWTTATPQGTLTEVELGRNERFHRNQRNRSIWWLAGVIMLSMGDAYVNAQLYGVTVTPDLTIQRDAVGVTAACKF